MRGQYTRGGTREELMAGYREEPGVDPLSRTETYAALRLEVDNWRWAGVPFYLRTGKRLPRRVTEVALQFQRPPHLPISAGAAHRAGRGRAGPADPAGRGHRAAVRRQGARAQLPGPHRLAWSSRTRSRSRRSRPEAYERLLLDALIGDPTLFIRSDEVRQCWRIVDPIIEHWANDPKRIPTYEAGSWGPDEADRLIERDGRGLAERLRPGPGGGGR